jgi:hypothetical protein
MGNWSIAVELGHPRAGSFRSVDGGLTWGSGTSYCDIGLGEYVVRVRLVEKDDDPPPPFRWESSSRDEILAQVSDLIPGAAVAGSDVDAVRALCHAIACRWEYTTTDAGVYFPPWDPKTIDALARGGLGPGGRKSVVWCIHFSAAFSLCALALGMPARCAVVSEGGIGAGHSLSEVWLPRHGKWIAADPTIDALFVDGDEPLSLDEVVARRSRIRELAVFGPGLAKRRGERAMRTWIDDAYLSGGCFANRSVWNRMDFLSHPEFTSPAHGGVAFCETELVWRSQSLERGFGMFPSFAEEDWFAAPPVAWEPEE